MYQAAENRYEKMEYKRCGRSGLSPPRPDLTCGPDLMETGAPENI